MVETELSEKVAEVRKTKNPGAWYEAKCLCIDHGEEGFPDRVGFYHLLLATAWEMEIDHIVLDASTAHDKFYRSHLGKYYVPANEYLHDALVDLFEDDYVAVPHLERNIDRALDAKLRYIHEGEYRDLPLYYLKVGEEEREPILLQFHVGVITDIPSAIEHIKKHRVSRRLKTVQPYCLT